MPSAEYQREWKKRNSDKCKLYQKRHRAKPEYKQIRDKQNHKWYREHTEEMKERARQYTLNNKESISASKKKYYIKNKERINQTRRLHYLKNRDRIRKTNAEYGRSPAGRRAAKSSFAKRKAALGRFTAEDIKDLYAIQGARCYYCSISIEEKFHIDHMTPISRGGSSWVDNICLTCVRCNLTKYTKTAEEFKQVVKKVAI